MDMQTNKAVFEKVRTLPLKEACVMATDRFGKVETSEDAIKLLDLYKIRKAECNCWEESFEFAAALYDEYKKTGNQLAFRLAKMIVSEL